MTTEEKIPLWKQLQACAGVVQVWRQQGRAEAIRKLLAPRKPPAQIDALLCVALALSWREEEAPYDAFTLVNQTVEAAKKNPQTRAQANFINACLRRFLREREALISKTDADPVARWNHPAWWIERLQADHPQHWQQILNEANRQAPMMLRVNQSKSSVPEVLAEFERAGIAAQPVGRSGLVLERALPVNRLPGFAEGKISVQDAAAQMAAPLLLDGLENLGSLRVLDACAAPGGKTGHLLEMGVGEVTALDVDPLRCERIGQNLARLGLQARVLAADAGETGQWWDGRPFDLVLLDAPCSASGIVRRHPDVRWLRRVTDIAQLALAQQRLLNKLWPLLAPGGRLLFCTCSVFAAEGNQALQTFLAHNTGARLLPSPGHLIPGICQKNGSVRDNQDGDHDGFFYALLQKQPH